MVIGSVACHAPVAALALAGYERPDYLPFPQATNLLVQEHEHAVSLSCPVGARCKLKVVQSIGIADKNRFVLFPGRLDAKVVVDPAVR